MSLLEVIGRTTSAAFGAAPSVADEEFVGVRIEVRTPRPSAEQLADAVLESLKLSPTDREALKQANDGVDIRDTLIADFRASGINRAGLTYIGEGQYAGRIEMSAENRRNLLDWSQTDGIAPDAATETTARQHELLAQGALSKHRAELALRKQEAQQQLVEQVLGKSGIQLARGTTLALAKPAAGVSLLEAAPLLAAGLGLVGTAAVLDKELELLIEKQVDAPLPPFPNGEPLPPPPPLITPDQSEQLRDLSQPLVTPATTITTGTPPFSTGQVSPPPPMITPTQDERRRQMLSDPMMARLVPLGFGSAEQFADATNRFKAASGVNDAVVGVRGSASTGVRHSGGEFGAASDVDFFVVSDQLFAQAMSAGARTRNGALSVGATVRFFPELHAVERQLTQELGRNVSIRIFSQEGFDAVKTGDEIIGK